MILVGLILYMMLLIVYFMQNNPKALINGVKISFANMFLLAFFAYTFLPVFDCILQNKDINYATSFIWKADIILVCLNLGMIIGRSIPLIKTRDKEYMNSNQVLLTVIWGVFSLSLLFINIILTRGGLSNYLSSTYRESIVNASSTIGALLYALMPYALIFLDKDIINNKLARILAVSFSSISIILTFMGGNRNIAVMIMLAGVWSFLKDVKFRVIPTLLMVLCGIIGLGVIASIREHGVINVLSGNANIDWSLVWKYAFSFSNGELGTTLKFEIYQDQIIPGFTFPFGFGFSYLVLPIINLIPSALWPGKPWMYADHFSHYAFGSFDGLGYGFSPIYEAQINFELLWWIIFLILGIFICNRDRRKLNKSSFYNNGLMACIMLNFFRIDFSVCFKFFAMMWCFKWLYLKSFSILKAENSENVDNAVSEYSHQ